MCTYLAKRGATYYFRRVIPAELRPALGGKAEFMLSLRTKDRETAKRLIPDKTKETDRLIDVARARLGIEAPPAPPRPANRAPSQYELEQDALRNQDEAEREARREAREALLPRLEDALSLSTAEVSPREARLRDILRDLQFDLTTEQEHRLAERVERAEARRGIRPPSADATPSRSPGEPPRDATAEPAGEESAGTMLDTTIVDLWAAERRVQQQGVSMYRAAARWLNERVGRKPVEQITKQDIVAFKAKLVEEGCTPANIKNKLSRLRTLLQYAADNGYAASNVADGVSIRDTAAAKNRRRSFDQVSLNALFGSPLYSHHALPTDRRGGGEAAYWIPLLALFTGARREELGQLRPDDVVELPYPDEEGNQRSAWFLKLIEVDDGDGAGTKLKNAESERYVPVHPELERLGFIAFALAAKENEQARIFPDLKANKFGKLTDKWGQWFTDYRRSVGVTDKRLVFHSFRHTFTDYARHAAIAEGIQRQLVGHSGDDVHDDYGLGYSLHRLVEGMKLYKVPGLKIVAPEQSEAAAA